MTTEQALKYIENLKRLKGYNNTTIGTETVGEILDSIASLLKKQLHWISAKESKPPVCPCICLVSTNDGRVMIAKYLGIDEKHEWSDGHSWIRVTHWMPMPMLPE